MNVSISSIRVIADVYSSNWSPEIRLTFGHVSVSSRNLREWEELHAGLGKAIEEMRNQLQKEELERALKAKEAKDGHI